MYAPLQFVEQASSYVQIPNNDKASEWVNSVLDTWVKKVFTSDRQLIGLAKGYSHYAGKILTGSDIAYNQLLNQKDLFSKVTKTKSIGLQDYAELMFVKTMQVEWEKTRQVFKVDRNLLEDLCNMKFPNLKHLSMFKYLPVDTFYIDFNGVYLLGSNIEGMFLTRKEDDGVMYLISTLLVQDDLVFPTFNVSEFVLADIESGKITTADLDYHDTVTLEFARGITTEFQEKKMMRFLMNFLLYLTAANKDVVYVDATVETKRSGNKVHRSKINSAEVGYRISSSYSKNPKRIRYMYNNGSDTVVREKRRLSSHYRSAHWHHFWKKNSKGEKELTLKWVEGTYVHGNIEANDTVVTVHKVK